MTNKKATQEMLKSSSKNKTKQKYKGENKSQVLKGQISNCLPKRFSVTEFTFSRIPGADLVYTISICLHWF